MYWIGGPDGMISFYEDANGYAVHVSGQRLRIDDSPLVLTPDPPIGPVSQINFGTLYQQLMEALRNAPDGE